MAKRVFISAGHGGSDPGAVSLNGKYREADLALRLRNLVFAGLRTRGVEVISDGEAGENKPLRDAVEIAKKNSTGISVELHFNAAGPSASGVEALAYPNHRVLCQRLCGVIANRLGSPLRGDLGWKPQDSGQHHRLAFCEAGGIILEVCFISNKAELRTYLQSEKDIADALAGVLAAWSVALS